MTIKQSGDMGDRRDKKGYVNLVTSFMDGPK